MFLFVYYTKRIRRGRRNGRKSFHESIKIKIKLFSRKNEKLFIFNVLIPDVFWKLDTAVKYTGVA